MGGQGFRPPSGSQSPEGLQVPPESRKVPPKGLQGSPDGPEVPPDVFRFLLKVLRFFLKVLRFLLKVLRFVFSTESPYSGHLVFMVIPHVSRKVSEPFYNLDMLAYTVVP